MVGKNSGAGGGGTSGMLSLSGVRSAPIARGPTTSANLAASKKNASVVPTRYFTPAEAAIPPIKSSSNGHAEHFPFPINLPPEALEYLKAELGHKFNLANISKSSAYPTKTASSPSSNTFDGFMILDSTGNPNTNVDSIQSLTLCNRNLHTVVEEDFEFFTNLQFIDVSENRLSLEPFRFFPRLIELRLACNHLSHISSSRLHAGYQSVPHEEDEEQHESSSPTSFPTFSSLLYLDLSYNTLTIPSIVSLYSLTNLLELDLSGNNLTTLPMDLHCFNSLQSLNLQYNKLDDNQLLNYLASIPNLRILDISHNYFSFIPQECAYNDGWKLLEVLDISFNYFPSEESIWTVTRLSRLLHIMLYGNPLLGITGEDALCITIENVMNEAQTQRDNSESTLNDLSFITQFPRKRVLKKGQPLGRYALYRDFSMVNVDPETNTKSTREWKKQGRKTLFSEAMAKNGGNSAAAMIETSAPDFTFLTNSIAAGNFASTTMTTNGNSDVNHIGGTNILGEHADAVACEAMDKIVGEMGLLKTAELRLFEDLVRLPETVVESQQRQREEKAATQSIFLNSQDPLSLNYQAPIVSSSTDLEEQQNIDSLPISLLKENNGTLKKFAGQPVGLKTAMKALERAINHPLTDHNDCGDHAKRAGHVTAKQTVTSRARQLPRVSRSGDDLPSTINRNGTIKGSSTLQRSNGGDQRYNVESETLASVRRENRNRTLHQINAVLEDLTTHTDQLLQADADLQKRSQDVVAAAIAVAENGRTSDSDQAAMSQTLSQVKQEMQRLRDFAQPGPAVTSLLNMANEVEREFNFS